MRKLLAVLCLLAMTACGTVKSDIAALQVTLSAAETAAGAYVALPLCDSVAEKVPCAQLDIIKKIKTADDAAYLAVSAARAAPDQDTLARAQTAVATLQGMITVISTAGAK